MGIITGSSAFLPNLLGTPGIESAIVGDYQGPYSVSSARVDGQESILLRADAPSSAFPSTVKIGGRVFPVVVLPLPPPIPYWGFDI